MSNIIPFINIREFFSNVHKDEWGELVGDCNICKNKNVGIFRHNSSCWKLAIQEYKDRTARANKKPIEKSEKEK